MRRQGEQCGRRPNKERETIAHAPARLPFIWPNRFPCPGQADAEDQYSRPHNDSAGGSPVGQKVEIVIVRPVRPGLDAFGPVLPKPIIIMRWSDPKPKVIRPHPLRRLP